MLTFNMGIIQSCYQVIAQIAVLKLMLINFMTQIQEDKHVQPVKQSLIVNLGETTPIQETYVK